MARNAAVARMPVLMLIASLCLLNCARADAIRLEVHRGWGDVERSGRWNPIFVRASSPTPRDISLELISPTDAGFASVVHEHVAIGPAVATFELFAPAHYSTWQQSVLVLRDAVTGKTLAQQSIGRRPSTAGTSDFGPAGIFIGITGRTTLLETLRQGKLAQTGYLPGHLLPRSSIGYDGLEILLLNAPSARELDEDQQAAVLHWIEAGGTAIYVPGGESPLSGPLAAALPCQVGTVTAIDADPDALEKTGLAPRFAHLAGRLLTPTSGAHPLELLPGGKATAWSGRVGLGQILVSPIDLAELEFQAPGADEKGAAFWKPILQDLVRVAAPQSRRKFDAPFYGYQSESEDQQREGAATSILCDFIRGNDGQYRRLPATSYALLIIFLLIGPVDSVVLRLHRRRAITPITIVGWLGFVGVIGLMTVNALEPEKHHYAAVRVVDQMGNQTVAVCDLVAVSSSKGDAIPIEATDGWWQSAFAGGPAAISVFPQADETFHGSDSAHTPDPVTVDPGRGRFLRSDNINSAAPVINAALSIKPNAPSAAHISGRITNLSDRPFTSLRVRTRFGIAGIPLPAGGLPAGQSIAIDLPAIMEAFAPADLETRYQSYGYFGSHADSQPVDRQTLWAIAPDLAGRRSLRIDELMARTSEFACIYAESADFEHAGTNGSARRDYQWTRALVPVNR